MNRTNITLVIILVTCCFGAFAQAKKDKKKEKDKPKTEEKVPVYNYIIDDPMDVFGRNPEPAIPIVLFPDFYSYYPAIKGDTTFKYLCYDRRDSLINVDTLRDIDAVRYISLFVNYPDHQHNYRNAEGQILPLPVSKIIRRYDKLGPDKWMSIDYANNKYKELQENKASITRTETVTITHPVTHNTFTRQHSYYQVK